jgi:hypothetical protein
MTDPIRVDPQERRNGQVVGMTPSTRTRATLTLAVLASSVVLVLVSSPALGYKIRWPDFARQGTLSADRLSVRVSGRLGCAPEEGDWEIQATVTQEASGASAVGIAQGECLGGTQTFTTDVTAEEGGPFVGIAFQEGSALVCGLGTNRFGRSRRGASIITDSRIWCNFITLVRAAG